jgi:hypothetical protein
MRLDELLTQAMDGQTYRLFRGPVSSVALLHVQKLSLEQFETLLGQLLQVPSGGRFLL